MYLGMILLVCGGFAQSICLTPLAAVMLRVTEPAYRGRVMGMRVLAIWGLSLGLFVAGPLIDAHGFVFTATLYSFIGLVLTVGMAIIWRKDLWYSNAPANVHI